MALRDLPPQLLSQGEKVTFLTAAPTVPGDTIRAARASFGSNNPYIVLGDRLSRLSGTAVRPDSQTRDDGQLRRYPSLPALITVLQFKEGIADRQAVEAIRTRIDWKYALHLPLNLPDLPVEWLCTQRQQLLNNPAAREGFQALLSWLSGTSFVETDPQMAVDAFVLAVCRRSRVARVIELFCQALEVLAAQHGEWLRTVALPHWYFWYARELDPIPLPSRWGNGTEVATNIGADVCYLLKMCTNQLRADITSLPAIRELQEIFERQYRSGAERSCWRSDGCLTCGTGAGLYDRRRAHLGSSDQKGSSG